MRSPAPEQHSELDAVIRHQWPPAGTELSGAEYDLWCRWFPTGYRTGEEPSRFYRRWKDFPGFADIPAEIRAEMDVLLATVGTKRGFNVLEIREDGPDPALFGIKLTPPEEPRYALVRIWGGPALTTDEIERGLAARDRVSSLEGWNLGVMIASGFLTFLGALYLHDDFLPALNISLGSFRNGMIVQTAVAAALIAATPLWVRIKEIKRQFSYAFA